MAGKQNPSVCGLGGGGAWFHQSLGHRHCSDPLSGCGKQRGQAQRYPLPKHSLQRWRTLGAWHCRSSEEDEHPTCPAESKASLHAERSSHPAPHPAASARGCAAADVPNTVHRGTKPPYTKATLESWIYVQQKPKPRICLLRRDLGKLILALVRVP